MRLVRGFLRIKTAGILLSAVLLACLSVASLRAEDDAPSPGWLAEKLTNLLSSPGHGIEIGRVGGHLPNEISIASITLSDPQGPWAELRNVTAALTLRDLFRRTVTVRQLSAAEARIMRAPAYPPSPKPETPSGSFSFSLPKLPVSLDLRSVQIDALHVAPAVLGEEVTATIGGSAALHRDGTGSVNLAVRRTDAVPGNAEPSSATLAVSLSGSNPAATLAVKIEAAERSGLLLDALLDRTDRLPLTLSLDGTAPVTDWHGKLAAAAGDRATVDADLALAQQDSGYRFAAKGSAAPGPLLPDTARPLAGGTVDFDLAAALTDNNSTLRADRIAIAAAAGSLDASGRLDLAGKAIDATAHVQAKDLSLLSPLVEGHTLSGSGTAAITARGALDHPQTDVQLDLADPRYDGNGAARITAQLAAAPNAPLTDPNAAVTLTGNGRIAGIVSPSAPIPNDLGDSIDWRLDATAKPNALSADIAALDVSGAGLSLTAAGQVDAKELSGDGTLHLAVADLGRFSGVAGRPLSGSGKLDLVAHQTADGSTAAKLDGHFADLALGVPAADGLLGGRLDLSGDATRAADGAIDLPRFEASGENVRLAATASLPPGADRIKATYRVDLPKLAPLSSIVGQAPLAGHVTLNGTAEGPLDAVAAAATLDAGDLVAGNARLDRLTARLTATASAEPAGKLDAEFRSAGLAGTLNGAFALRGTDPASRRLDIPKLRLAAGGTTIEAASLQTALDTLLTSGTVTARIPDLAPWSQLAGTNLAGRVDLKAALGTARGQSLDLTLNGAGLSAAPSPGSRVAVDRVALAAKLADLLGKPSGKATLAVDRAALGGSDRIDTVRLNFNAPHPGRVAFTGDIRGRVQQPIDLALGGEASIGAADALELKLAKLAGEVAGERVQLRQPLTLAKRGADMSFGNLSVALGSGQVTGSGALKGKTIALKLLAKRLPLAFAGRFAGHEDVSGTLGADIDLSGTVDRPEGRAVVEGQDVRLATLSRPDLPPIAMSADAAWRGGRVDFKGRVDAPKMEGIGFSGAAPLVLRHQPSLGVDVPRDGAVALRLEGGADLAKLAELLPIGEDRIAGMLQLDARVGGTIAAPAASGRVTLSRVRYENLASGFVVNDLSAELDGDQDRFAIRHFTAKDGTGKGELQVSGGVVLSAAPGPALDIKAAFRRFQVVRRDDATGSASGDVQIGGSLTAPRVAAQIRVEEADINIPDRLPPNVRRLDVIEINSKTGEAEKPPSGTAAAGQDEAGAQGGGAAAVALDIAVDIPGRVFVRGRGLESEWRGKLAVNGTAAEPVVVGRLEVVRGSFSFLGKNFQLTQGTVSFDGGHKIDPALAITTQATANDVTAQVQITGTASQPSIRLTSVPELPQDEILSRVLFGRNLTQITPAQGLQLAQAAAALAGGGGPGILDTVRGRLGLDRLDIGSAGSSGGLVNQLTNPNQTAAGQTAATSGTTGVGGTTVSAGKYVANGVYVGVDQSVSGQSRARVEVEITPNISVETDVGAQGSQGVGLNWKMDY